MNVADVITALDLPAGSRVDQRVPKKLLAEHGAPTAADKRKINEGIEEIHWLAALKSTTISVPEFRDQDREYLEIAVLSVALRPGAKSGRLAELIHRAVPYPVFLIVSQDDALEISLSHKRWSLSEAGSTALDGALVAADLGVKQDAGFGRLFLKALPIVSQPRANLYSLYQGWMDTALTLAAARVTGKFAAAESQEDAAARRSALIVCSRLNAQISGLRAAAAKEKRISRQVELNLEIKRMQAQLAQAKGDL